MKKVILVFNLLLITLYAYAQAPDWQWTTQAGGSDFDIGFGIAIDDYGNSYVTGWFEGTATFGSHFLTSNGSYDIFVAKMDATGNWLWATQAGGSIDDSGRAIAIDDAGNSYVTGYFKDTATFDSCSLTSNGDKDIFVAKMDAAGNWLWAVQAGGSINNYGSGIAADDNGNSYVTGIFNDNATFGSYSLTCSGIDDIFVAKMDATGNWLWATNAGGISHDDCNAITIDNIRNSYVTGIFYDNATFGSYSLTSSGNEDIFVAKMDENGNWLWATQAGGSDYDNGFGIATDNNGNSYVTGRFRSTATFGSYSLISSGNCDIFVAKMDATGNWLWATNAGGSGIDTGFDIATDSNGNSYITGNYSDTATFGSYSLTSSGDKDIFVSKIDANGNWLWATNSGGSGIDYGFGITADDYNISYVTGWFQGTATFGPYSLTSNGGSDIFVAKLGNYTSVEYDIIPTKMKLSNYPNPFNPTTTIEFSIENNSKVELAIYSIKGQKIKTLTNDQFTKCSHSINWNGDDDNSNPVSSGVYYYKLKVNGKTEAVKKCLLLK